MAGIVDSAELTDAILNEKTVKARIGPFYREVREKDGMTEIIQSTENISAPTTEAQPEPAQPTPQQVRDQQLKDLLAWLNERGLQIVPVAIATRNGAVMDINGFLPATHFADWSLQEQSK